MPNLRLTDRDRQEIIRFLEAGIYIRKATISVEEPENGMGRNKLMLALKNIDK